MGEGRKEAVNASSDSTLITCQLSHTVLFCAFPRAFCFSPIPRGLKTA